MAKQYQVEFLFSYLMQFKLCSRSLVLFSFAAIVQI